MTFQTSLFQFRALDRPKFASSYPASDYVQSYGHTLAGTGPKVADVNGESSVDRTELSELPLLAAGRQLTPEEVGLLLGVNRRRVYAIRESGSLTGYKVGRSLRFAPSEVIRLLEDGRDSDRGDGPTW